MFTAQHIGVKAPSDSNLNETTKAKESTKRDDDVVVIVFIKLLLFGCCADDDVVVTMNLVTCISI